jgi:hypothetical protein
LPANPVAIAGGTILAGRYLFREPSTGWTSTSEPQAQLFTASGPSGESFGPEGLSPTTAALTTSALGPQHECPCHGTIWLFTQPSAGWSGVIAAMPALDTQTGTGDVPIAIDGSRVFVGGAKSVAVYDASGMFGHQSQPPRISRVHIRGLAAQRPAVRFSVSVPQDAPPIKTLVIKLPRGLSVRRAHRRPPAGIAVSPGHSVVHRERQQITISLSQPAVVVRVSVRPNALSESARLTRHMKMVESRRRQKRRRKSVHIGLVVEQILGSTSHLQLAVR